MRVMKHDSDDEFLSRCRNIDFSAESTNYNKNLNALKGKLTNNDEEIYVMKKSKKLSVAIAAIMIAIMIPVAALAVNTLLIGDKIYKPSETKVIQGEEYVHYYEAYESSDGGTISAISIDSDATGPIVVEEDGVQRVHADRSDDIYDIDEALSLLALDGAIAPAYLAGGFAFEYAYFSIDPVRNPDDFIQSMSARYSDGEKKFTFSVMHYPEEWGMFQWTPTIEDFEIDGYKCKMGGGGLIMQVGEIIYSFDSRFYHNIELDNDQLIKLAESLLAELLK